MLALGDLLETLSMKSAVVKSNVTVCLVERERLDFLDKSLLEQSRNQQLNPSVTSCSEPNLRATLIDGKRVLLPLHFGFTY